jgi:hypothetical protein
MPEIYEENALWVDDADDLLGLEVEEPIDLGLTEGDISDIAESVKDSPHTEYVTIGEGDMHAPEHGKHDEIVVTEEDKVPGSDILLVEEDEADAKDKEPVKPKTWEQDKEHSQFVAYIIDKKNKIPKHSGETIPGCERAKSFLKSIDNEISQAMRTDLDGVIDEQQIDAVRKELDSMIDRLDRQINKLKKKTKKAEVEVRMISEGQCEKCKSVAPMWHDVINNKVVCMHCEAENAEDATGLEKTAGTPIINVYVTAFERAVVGTIVNSAVSGGRDIEETYERLKNKYNFTPREELAIQQLVADYGYPVYKDRGLLNEPADPAAGDGVEWQTNYHA